MKQKFSLNVNGQSHTVEVEPDTPLLYVLRNQLALNGPKFGCGLEQCGSCMVLLDDQATPSCRIPVAATTGQPITTLKGLMQEDGTLHPVQQAFEQEQTAQCGYCLNGMIISAVALLKENPQPDEASIRQGMQRVLCRCGTYPRVIQAVQAAAKTSHP